MKYDHKIKWCPLTKRTCKGDVCQFWSERVMTDLKTDEQTIKGQCEINWLTDLMLDASKNAYSTGQAVENLRETVSKQNDAALRTIALTLQAGPGVVPGPQSTGRIGHDQE